MSFKKKNFFEKLLELIFVIDINFFFLNDAYTFFKKYENIKGKKRRKINFKKW